VGAEEGAGAKRGLTIPFLGQPRAQLQYPFRTWPASGAVEMTFVQGTLVYPGAA
jgi:hypothetical protein